MFFFDFIAELGLLAVKDRALESIQKQEVKDEIKSFLEREAKYNELVSREEEIDFEGLYEYIASHLAEDVKDRLFGKISERIAATQTILAKAVSYSKAMTPESIKRVKRIILNALDILSRFYRSKVNRELLFVSAEIIDSVNEICAEQHMEQSSAIAESVFKKLDSQSLFSVDRSLKSINEGDISEVESILSKYNRALNGGHVLFPDYGFKIESNGINSVLKSHPLHKDAVVKFPPKIKALATASIGNEKVMRFSTSSLDYAYRHQFPITLNIKDAKKFLGDVPDPIQHEAEGLIGKKFVFNPKPFPEAFPCSISIDDEVAFDYVLFRTVEILDDGTYVITNSEQAAFPFRILLKLNEREQSVRYSLSINNGSNADYFKFSQFNKTASQGGELSCRILSSGNNLFSAKLEPFEYESTFDSIDQDIEFYKNIIAIEEYLGTSIEIPNEYRESDLVAIQYFGELARGLKYHGSWDSFECTNVVTEEFKQSFDTKYNSIGPVTYIGSVDLLIFNVSYHLNITRAFSNVAIKNFSEIKEQVSTLKIGDTVDLVLTPDDEKELGTFEDALYKASKNA